MKLLFKQRLFSWLDSYDIFGEDGQVIYTVKGQLSWGHCLKIFDANGYEVGMVKERIFSSLSCIWDNSMSGVSVGNCHFLCPGISLIVTAGR